MSYHKTPVLEFHEAFGAPVALKPTFPSIARRQLRCALLIEEVIEFCEASGFLPLIRYSQVGSSKHTVEFISTKRPPDLVEAADALADIRYVTDGASLEWGIPLHLIEAEVHRSNMSKLGLDGKPILREDGKILKGPHYTPPAIAELLEAARG